MGACSEEQHPKSCLTINLFPEKGIRILKEVRLPQMDKHQHKYHILCTRQG